MDIILNNVSSMENLHLLSVSHFWNSSTSLPDIFQQKNSSFDKIFLLLLQNAYSYKIWNAFKLWIPKKKNTEKQNLLWVQAEQISEYAGEASGIINLN